LTGGTGAATKRHIKAAGGPKWVSNEEARRLMDDIEAEVDGESEAGDAAR